MPPHRRNVERVARTELHLARRLQRLGEPGISLEIGRIDVDETDRLAGEREIQRPDVEVLQLPGREQGPPPPARDDAGEILRLVPMRRRMRPIADPQRDERIARHVEHFDGNVRDKPGQMLPDRDPARVDRIRLLLSALAQQQVEELIEARKLPLEVEAAEIRSVFEAAIDSGRREPCLERLVRRGEAQHRGERFGPVPGGAHDRPVGDQAAEHGGLAPGDDLALEARAIHRLIFGDRPHAWRLAAATALRQSGEPPEPSPIRSRSQCGRSITAVPYVRIPDTNPRPQHRYTSHNSVCVKATLPPLFLSDARPRRPPRQRLRGL